MGISQQAVLHMLTLPNFLSSQNGDFESDLACHYSLQRNNKEINSKFFRNIVQTEFDNFSFIFTEHDSLLLPQPNHTY